MSILGEAVVSCYADAVAFLVAMLLLLLSEPVRGRESDSLRIFFLLDLLVAIESVVCFVTNAMYMHPAPWCHTVAVVGRTVWESIVLWLNALWLLYVYLKLYGSEKRNLSAFLLTVSPIVILQAALIVNLFTGFAFTYSAENRFRPTPYIFVIYLIEFLYFSFSALIVRRFDQKAGKIRFLSVTPMIVSVFGFSAVQLFLPYHIGVIGFAIGITLLYFSMMGEIHYVDAESGLYNKGYLAYLFDLAIAGKNDARSALIIEADGNISACCGILRDVLHRNGDVIRTEDRRFLMFSGTDSRSTMQYYSSLVEESVEKYVAEHPDEKAAIVVRCRMRAPGEDAFTFLRTVTDEKDSGDEMRGIVSMMTELDRLDKELKLASDIQTNMLPMVFPPFPERTEFDLYAATAPAKEVGGDFYDFFLVDQDHLALVIADVSGKGIPAALFMMVSKTLIKNQMMSGQDPASAIEWVNRQLCERNSSMMFVTVWLALIEISTGKCLVCNAGHENPVIRRDGGDFEVLKYKHGMFIGVKSEAKYSNREVELHPGDCVFVYTDGVPEAVNAENKMFGEKRLAETLNQDPAAAPDELIRRVREAVDSYAGSTQQFDDITMLCLRYVGSGEKE